VPRVLVPKVRSRMGRRVSECLRFEVDCNSPLHKFSYKNSRMIKVLIKKILLIINFVNAFTCTNSLHMPCILLKNNYHKTSFLPVVRIRKGKVCIAHRYMSTL